MGDRAFYEIHWRQRGGRLKNEPHIAEKTRLIIEAIPPDVRTIVDVGCGDGAITNELSKRFTVTAVDRSRAALHHVEDRATVLQSDASDIDLPDIHADLVFSSEMLEHILPLSFSKVVGELERLARRYPLLSVPNNEELRQRRTRCQVCGKEFHIYRHFRRFTKRRINALFPGWKLVTAFACGADETSTLRFVSALRNRLVRSFFFGVEGATPCPRCGAVIQRRPLNRAQRLASGALNLLERTLLKGLWIKPYPDWLVVLLAR